MDTEWQKGSFNHEALWSTYFVLNYVGAILCVYVMIAIYKLQSKNSGDIFVSGLCLGCFGMSITCATQCFLNTADGKGYFSWGQAACDAEAFAHVANILLQFFCIGFIGLRSYMAVIKGIAIHNRTAVIMVLVAWGVAWIGTFIFGRFSTIYLMPAGAYCFYQFNSPTIFFWFVPVMLISLFCIIYWYFKIFTTTKEILMESQQMFFAKSRIAAATAAAHRTANSGASTPTGRNGAISPAAPTTARNGAVSPQQVAATHSPHAASPALIPAVAPGQASPQQQPQQQQPQVVRPSANDPSQMSMQVARRTSLYVLIFFIGWGPAVATAFYELFVGPVIQELDTMLAVFGSFHSVMVPVVYGYLNPRLRRVLKALCCCRSTVEAQRRSSTCIDGTTMDVTKIKSGTYHTQTPENGPETPNAEGVAAVRDNERMLFQKEKPNTHRERRPSMKDRINGPEHHRSRTPNNHGNGLTPLVGSSTDSGPSPLGSQENVREFLSPTQLLTPDPGPAVADTQRFDVASSPGRHQPSSAASPHSMRREKMSPLIEPPIEELPGAVPQHQSPGSNNVVVSIQLQPS